MIRKYVETYDGGGSGFGSSEGYTVNYFAFERPSEEFLAKYAGSKRAEEVRYVVIDGEEYYWAPPVYYGQKQEKNYKLTGKPVYLTFQDIVDDLGPNVLKNSYY